MSRDMKMGHLSRVRDHLSYDIEVSRNLEPGGRIYGDDLPVGHQEVGREEEIKLAEANLEARNLNGELFHPIWDLLPPS